MKKTEEILKIVAIVGPTASGKSDLAIRLAKKFNGEIINADSRQIYKYMDIGTAKDSDDDLTDDKYTVKDVPVHLIDFLTPDESFSVADFQKLAYEKIFEIVSRGKIPFLAGGTGLWVDSVCKGYVFEKGEAFGEIRKDLNEKNVDELYSILKEMNPDRANALNESDRRNPRRLIRVIEKELAETTPLNPPLSGGTFQYLIDPYNPLDSSAESNRSNRKSSILPPDTCAEQGRSNGGLGCGNNFSPDKKVHCLYLSPRIDFPTIEKRIYARVDKMFELGLLEENKKLIEMGYTYNLPSMSGIGYKEFEGYFKGEKTLDEVRKEIRLRTRQYAKRQVTWFRKNNDIKHVDFEESLKRIRLFL